MPEPPGTPPAAPPSETPGETGRVVVHPRTGGRAGAVLVGFAIVVVVALFGITWLGREITAAPIPLTATVTVLPYLYGGVLAGLFGLWAIAPDRRLIPALLAVVVLGGAVLWGPALTSRGQDAAGLPVRVASWNVRRLWGGPGDDGEPYACVVDTLREMNADVVSLQEVTGQDVYRLASALELSCSQIDYLGSRDPDDGGVAVCVRKGPWKLHSSRPHRYVAGRAWNYVFAEIAQGERIFNLLAVHLQPYRLGRGDLARANRVPEVQGDQSAELLRRVSRFRDPTILAGDFNSTRDAALHVALRSPLIDAHEQAGSGLGATFHLLGWLPIRIDYVYVTDAFTVRASRIVPRDCSDHRPIVTDLVLR